MEQVPKGQVPQPDGGLVLVGKVWGDCFGLEDAPAEDPEEVLVDFLVGMLQKINKKQKRS